MLINIPPFFFSLRISALIKNNFCEFFEKKKKKLEFGIIPKMCAWRLDPWTLTPEQEVEAEAQREGFRKILRQTVEKLLSVEGIGSKYYRHEMIPVCEYILCMAYLDHFQRSQQSCVGWVSDIWKDLFLNFPQQYETIFDNGGQYLNFIPPPPLREDDPHLLIRFHTGMAMMIRMFGIVSATDSSEPSKLTQKFRSKVSGKVVPRYSSTSNPMSVTSESEIQDANDDEDSFDMKKLLKELPNSSSKKYQVQKKGQEVSQRSKDLNPKSQRVKPPFDDFLTRPFKIAIWSPATKQAKEFTVRPKDTIKDLKYRVMNDFRLQNRTFQLFDQNDLLQDHVKLIDAGLRTDSFLRIVAKEPDIDDLGGLGRLEIQ